MILYNDNEIVVCIKEKGVLSQQGKPGQKSMIDILADELGSEIYPVHRLDKEVSGVMVYAKTKAAAADLSAQVSSREMEKHYIATTQKSTLDHEGTMEDLLYFDKSKNKSFVVKKERKGVKKAILEYKEISSDKDRSQFLVRLLTGRTHQIRVQFASRGYAICGDRRYGAVAESGKIIALAAVSLSIFHPVTNEKTDFSIEPKNLRECEEQFK